jgi:hypothetical protein
MMHILQRISTRAFHDPILTVLLQPSTMTTHGIDCADVTTVLAWSQQGHLLIVDQLTHTERHLSHLGSQSI